MAAKRKLKVVPTKDLLKLDFGCGPNPKEGFVGCDQYQFKGVTHVFDIGRQVWPFDDNSVEEAHASHFVEHLSAEQRVHFYNELHRVLIKGGKCAIIVPAWSSNRAYGDPTHQWPPVSEMSFYYLNKEWRMKNAPHTDAENWDKGFRCDFDATWGYGMHGMLQSRNDEFKQFALNFYKEAAQDIAATVTKR